MNILWRASIVLRWTARTSLGQRSVFSTAKEIQFDVFIVNSAGRFTKERVDIKSMKHHTPGLHARDVVSLGILLDSKRTSSSARRKNFTNIIKVRENFVLAALGSIRIILKPTELIIFDPHLQNVKSWVSHLSRQLQTNDDHFGLFVLEDLLRDTCASFDRRLGLYNSLLRSIQAEAREKQSRDASGNILDYSLLSNMLKEESNSMHRRSESPITKLAPLQDLLFEFELQLKDVRSCVMEVLNNTESLQRVNITAAKLEGDAGAEADDSAELIFETYGLRLSTSESGLLHLQQRVKSEQTLADLNIRMKRNRILWLNVNLSAASLAIGFAGGCMASFGMNLPSGLEVMNYAFYGVCASSVGVSAWVYMRLLRYMRGDFSRTVEATQLAERKFLENVFSDIDVVDVVLNSALREVNYKNAGSEKCNLLTKKEFSEMFAAAKGVQTADKEEVDIIFGLLDENNDDMIYKHELDVVLDEYEDDESISGLVPVLQDNDGRSVESISLGQKAGEHQLSKRSKTDEESEEKEKGNDIDEDVEEKEEEDQTVGEQKEKSAPDIGIHPSKNVGC